MHRIQIQLTAKQEHKLRDLAKLRGQSISALVREGVERLLQPEFNDWEARKARALAAVGRGADGGDRGLGDVSERHDAYLADAAYDDIVDNHL